ncbi:hypothetical protein HPB48_012716 [Haemaphysalis longicornis]|uniref:RNase NYN domain-containing protein n=1 Tax=Haemaphysalis longicornis TaxID=44386 RepID=A0A9J6H4H5_HAELO|nr:hypothetical protein HPB48_012716 [Haemaphysalis longicornis]
MRTRRRRATAVLGRGLSQAIYAQVASLARLTRVFLLGEMPGSPTRLFFSSIHTCDNAYVDCCHGNKEVFSCRGIQLAVEWFRARGHMDISVFVPSWRKEASRAETPIKDQEILLQLEKERLLFFTPSRNVGGKRMVCYEDRYILKVAAQTDGVVVSNDNYRDLVAESLDFKRVVEERLLNVHLCQRPVRVRGFSFFTYSHTYFALWAL